MKSARVIVVALAGLVYMPIWYYLLYKILSMVHATELMWFLYWVYLPTGIVISVIQKLIEKDIV